MNDQPRNSPSAALHAARCRHGRTRAGSPGRRAPRRCLRSRRARGAPQAGHGPSSSCTRSPESSALGTNPHAPDVVTSGPKSEPSRLEVMITVGCSAYAGDLLADVEPVDVGQLDVEQHHLGPQAAALVQRARPVDRLADDLEPLGLQHHAGAGPERGVVVDDEDPVAHEHVNDCGRARIGRPYGWPHSPSVRPPPRRCRHPQGLLRRIPPNLPRTRSRRPRAHGPAVCASIPPSTSSAGSSPISARRRSILSSEPGRNAWPPQPGLTVMHSTQVEVAEQLRRPPAPACSGTAPGPRGSRRRAPRRARSWRAASPRRGS